MEIPYTVHERPDTGLWNAKVGVWLFLASEVMLFGGLFSAYIFLRIGADYWPHHALNVPLGLTNTIVLITSSITMVLAWVSVKMRDFGQFRFWMSATLGCGCLFVVIKSIEYRDKFSHYGVVFRDEAAFRKYEPELSALGANIKTNTEGHGARLDRTPHFEIAGHLASGVTADAIELAPDRHEGGAKGGAHGGALRVALADVARWGVFAPRYSTYYAIYFTLTGLHALHVLGGMVVLFYFLVTGAKMFAADPEHLANRVEVGGLFWHFVDLVWIFLFPVLYLL
ncbi:MAG TPA: cytochrome c oxidase subunit 3 [Verrucomicrobiae bacterium]|nr:cytochrome c oxidase subunit 3 [Verrucomicrobiae bacterium]